MGGVCAGLLEEGPTAALTLRYTCLSREALTEYRGVGLSVTQASTVGVVLLTEVHLH